MAWIYEIDNENASKSRVFQTVLGHDVAALRTPEVQTIIRRAARWVAAGTQLWNDL
jgi:type 1 glutamine amidotransferase